MSFVSSVTDLSVPVGAVRRVGISPAETIEAQFKLVTTGACQVRIYEAPSSIVFSPAVVLTEQQDRCLQILPPAQVRIVTSVGSNGTLIYESVIPAQFIGPLEESNWCLKDSENYMLEFTSLSSSNLAATLRMTFSPFNVVLQPPA